MAPRLMKRITDRGGSVVQRADPQEIGQVTSPENAAEMTDMMEDVVREGTGTAAALSSAGVTVAGKTGTAETDDPEKNQAWFIGFAPPTTRRWRWPSWSRTPRARAARWRRRSPPR